MATLQPRQALYYASALATFLYTTVSVAIDFGKVQNAREERKHLSRSYTIPISFIALSYTIEAITIAWQDHSFVHSEAQIVHATVLAVTWFVVGVRQRKHATATRELWGVSLLTTISEVGLFVLSLPASGFGSLGTTVLLVGWVVRLLLLLFAIVYMVYEQYTSKRADVDADETEPFLPRYDEERTQGEITAYGTEALFDHPSPATEEDDGSDSGDDSDDELIKMQRSKRLREAGSW